MKRFGFSTPTQTMRVLKLFAAGVSCNLLAGCNALPRDQHNATHRIQENRVLTVGISAEPEKPQSEELEIEETKGFTM